MTVDILIFTDYTNLSIHTRPSGAYRIATELRLAGFSVQVIDMLSSWSLTELYEIVDSFVGDNTLFVGFSSTFFGYILKDSEVLSGTHQSAFRHDQERYQASLFPFKHEDTNLLIQRIKEKNSTTKVVYGGAKAQFYKHMSQFNFDVYILGYADWQIVSFAKKLANHAILPSHLVLSEDYKGEQFDFQHSKIIWDKSDAIRCNETLPIEVARGCIFKCSYCAFPLNGKDKFDYIKDPQVVKEELIRNFELYGVTRYAVTDDTHNDTMIKLEQMAKITSDLPFELEYVTYLRHDLIYAHREMADLLYAAGCRGAVFGIETLNHEAGKAVGKGLHPEKTKELLLWLREKWGNEVSMHSGFIVGLPHETTETLDSTFKWIESEDCTLDSISTLPLLLQKDNVDYLWDMEISRNKEKNGYKVIGIAKGGQVKWQNEHMDFDTALSISNNFSEHVYNTGRQKIDAFRSFALMGMGFPKNKVFRVPEKSISIEDRMQMKLKIQNQYKKKILTLCN